MRVHEALALLGASVVLLLHVGGCGPAARSEGLCERMTHEDPYVRTRAILEAGRTKDPGTISCLIDRLGDDEPEVRMVAKVALEKITGQTMGYCFHDSADRRDEAIGRWRRWLERKVAAGATSRPAGSGG